MSGKDLLNLGFLFFKSLRTINQYYLLILFLRVFIRAALSSVKFTYI